MKKKNQGLVTQVDWCMKHNNEVFIEAINKDQELLKMLLDVKYPDKLNKTNIDKIVEKLDEPNCKDVENKFYEAIYKDNVLLKKMLKPIIAT